MAVRQALMSVDGVIEARVSYDDARAFVRFDPARVGPRALVEAVTRTGFGAEVADASSGDSSDGGQPERAPAQESGS
ncbi:MAG: cation transporter [Acidobacteriota bacterium]